MTDTSAETWTVSADFKSMLSSNNKDHHSTVSQIISPTHYLLEDGSEIKLIGIKPLNDVREKTPILKDDYGFIIPQVYDHQTPIDQIAFAVVEEMLLNKEVRLEYDVHPSDGNGLDYVYLYLEPSGTFVNEELLKQGLVLLSVKPPNTKYTDKLRDAYQYAREHFIGLHTQ